ncbi:HIT family protein [Corynebacterium pyruviciproducens]|uniref:HIT family protein n=1 Tax=Corynebacterium pyruviciproducens TaxID=598660 RepID=UPI00254E8902|nr:HIT domain-containing protein [Corynebacterium pyruviciproducens]MDK7214173.1 HIT domain-containing protein [Corynebacterium pyruviciproducens]
MKKEDALQCPFCNIVEGSDSKVREVSRTDGVVVFFPTDPAVLGHCLVIPTRHVETFTELRAVELQEVMSTAQAVAKSLDSTFHPQGINIIQSNGEAASQSVPHAHVHVVPRWDGDAIGELWPPESSYSEEEKDQALARLRVATILPGRPTTPEDRRQHLVFIQDIISRMAHSSAVTKGWLLPVTTAAYGYSFTKDSLAVALLGIVATVIFMFLDVGYLRTERKYRCLYNRVARGDLSVAPYSLDYREAEDTWFKTARDCGRATLGWAVGPFYFALLAVGVVAIFIGS